jgi:hypothetical protein
MSDKYISELDRSRYVNHYDLIPISQGIKNDEFRASVSQVLGDDSQWRRFNVSSHYRHPDPANYPKYRKVGKVTHLSGTLFIPYVFGDETHNYQSVKVDTNTFQNSNTGLLYMLSSDQGYNVIPLDASPSKSVFFRNIVLSQRYVVDQLNYNPNDDYSIPLSTVVTLEITPNGGFVIHAITSLVNGYFKSNPLTQLASVLPKDSKFPSFNQVNIGLSAENNAVTLPPFTNDILVPEDINTTLASDLGGFRIDLSGLHFINSRRKEEGYTFYNRS